MGAPCISKALISVLIIHRQISSIILEFSLKHQGEMMKFRKFLVLEILFWIR